MFGGDRDLDNICAISTPSGVGGIHLVRLSGPRSLEIIRKSASFLPQRVESHRVYFGTLSWGADPLDPIDEVLISFFEHGRSFTGEETVEISCHGSPFIAERVVKVLLRDGARLADKGEFTYRAFLNGKLDLVQAESVLGIIQSESKKAAEISLRQLKGGLSKEFKAIEEDLLALLARMEVSIDFSAEDVEIISVSEVSVRLEGILTPVLKLLNSFEMGRKIQSGFDVVLVGEPNVGKSSILNEVLAEDRSIVTDVAGTTRDLIQEKILIRGTGVTLIDSAGIRETTDAVEMIGVGRSRKAMETADLVLAIFDCSMPRLSELLEQLPDKLSKVVFIGNKIDLVTKEQISVIRTELQFLLLKADKFQNLADAKEFVDKQTLFISTRSNSVQESILHVIEANLATGQFGDDAIISNARHFENLLRTKECLFRAGELVRIGASPELFALELKEALVRLQEVLGEKFDDQILDKVFSEFCIGK